MESDLDGNKVSGVEISICDLIVVVSEATNA